MNQLFRFIRLVFQIVPKVVKGQEQVSRETKGFSPEVRRRYLETLVKMHLTEEEAKNHVVIIDDPKDTRELTPAEKERLQQWFDNIVSKRLKGQ